MRYQEALDYIERYIPKKYGSAESEQQLKVMNEYCVDTLQELIDSYDMCVDINKQIEIENTIYKKALDKACEILSKSKVNDLCLLVDSLDIQDKNFWKEYLLYEARKELTNE